MSDGAVMRRWLEAELADGPDAEALFRDTARHLPRAAVPAGLGDRIVAEVAPGAGRRSWVSTRVRQLATVTALAVSGVALVAYGAVVLAPLVAGQLFELLNFSTRGFVSLVHALDSGLDAWTIVASVSRAFGSAIATPQVTLGFVGVELVGVAALYGLHRVLRLERETP